MTAPLRHYCRHDRTKLAGPTDNLRRAFCCRGCFNSYFRSRCVVCEAPIRRKNERQRTCIDIRCKAELRRFPLAYAWPETTNPPYPTSNVGGPSKTPDFIGSKGALRGDRGAIWPDDGGGPSLRARLIEVEVFAPHVWERRINSDGAPIQVSRLRAYAAPPN